MADQRQYQDGASSFSGTLPVPDGDQNIEGFQDLHPGLASAGNNRRHEAGQPVTTLAQQPEENNDGGFIDLHPGITTSVSLSSTADRVKTYLVRVRGLQRKLRFDTPRQ